MENDGIDHAGYMAVIQNLQKENRDLRRKLKSCVMILNQIGNQASNRAKKVKKSTKLSVD